jgi:hypothetical protein
MAAAAAAVRRRRRSLSEEEVAAQVAAGSVPAYLGERRLKFYICMGCRKALPPTHPRPVVLSATATSTPVMRLT